MADIPYSFTLQFEPDILASEQYRGAYKATEYKEREKTLMLAILGDALTCIKDFKEKKYLKGPWVQHKGKRNEAAIFHKREIEYNAAMRWLKANHENEWIFSFHNICETLEVDPGFILRRLEKI